MRWKFWLTSQGQPHLELDTQVGLFQIQPDVSYITELQPSHANELSYIMIVLIPRLKCCLAKMSISPWRGLALITVNVKLDVYCSYLYSKCSRSIQGLLPWQLLVADRNLKQKRTLSKQKTRCFLDSHSELIFFHILQSFSHLNNMANTLLRFLNYLHQPHYSILHSNHMVQPGATGCLDILKMSAIVCVCFTPHNYCVTLILFRHRKGVASYL